MRSAQALGVVAFRLVELERASVRNARQSDDEHSLAALPPFQPVGFS
jgi:hypothetical protein